MFKKIFGYKEAFLFVGFFPFLGFLIEVLVKTDIKYPQMPTNIYLFLIIILIIAFSHIFLLKNYFVKSISGIKVALAALTYMSVLVLIMALIPQNTQSENFVIKTLKLNYMSKNIAMFLTALFLLYSLGLVILKRLSKFNFKNFAFFLNHFGLWLLILVAVFGNGDLVRLQMYIYEKEQPEWRAKNDNAIYELPIAIKLIDFEIDEFNPEIGLVENETGNIIVDKKNKVYVVEENTDYKLNDYKIKIDTFLKSSMRINTKYVEFFDEGSVPALYLSVYNNENQKVTEGWVSSASFMMSPKLLELNQQYSIGLLEPTPQKYSSKVELFAEDSTKISAVIEVNKPIKFKGWKIYQVSYDETKGRWSELSVLELVRDPWIWLVYTGIYMILVGAVLIFWVGKNKKDTL